MVYYRVPAVHAGCSDNLPDASTISLQEWESAAFGKYGAWTWVTMHVVGVQSPDIWSGKSGKDIKCTLASDIEFELKFEHFEFKQCVAANQFDECARGNDRLCLN